MACATMQVKGTDPDSGEDFDTTIQACTHKAACGGWEGTVDEVYYNILDCGATKLFASLAASAAVACLM